MVGRCSVIWINVSLSTSVKKQESRLRLNGQTLGEGNVQHALGVLVHQSLKVSMQLQQAVKKARGLFTFIARGFVNRSRDVLLQLYRALVRPHLEYCLQFVCPYLRKDVLAMEGEQRRFTRLTPGMAGLTYVDRMCRLRLFRRVQKNEGGSQRNLSNSNST